MKRALFAWALVAAACGREDLETTARELTVGGDPARGRIAVRQRGCGSCHTISDLRGAAMATVGPPLDGLRGRRYLAGQLENNAVNLMRWIQDPQGVIPGNVMPDMGIPIDEARDIAAYLYSRE